MLSTMASIFTDRPGQGMTLDGLSKWAWDKTLPAGIVSRKEWKPWEALRVREERSSGPARAELQSSASLVALFWLERSLGISIGSGTREYYFFLLAPKILHSILFCLTIAAVARETSAVPIC